MFMHGLLMEMFDGTPYTEEKIRHQFSDDIFEDAEKEGYIIKYKSSDNSQLYVITEKGKNALNKNNC